MQGYFINEALLPLAATFEADARLDSQLDDPRFLAAWPRVAEVIPHLRAAELEGIFASGMDIILDGIERQADKSSAIPGRDVTTCRDST